MGPALSCVIQPGLHFHLKKYFIIWKTVRCKRVFAIVHLVTTVAGSGNKEKIKHSPYSGRW